MSKFVRLYPHAPKRGYLVQTYVMRGTMYRGGPRPTWYEVDDPVAAEFGALLQNPTDPDSKPLFQICTKEQKETIAKDEQDMFLASIGAVARTVPNPSTIAPPPTVDLTAKPAPGDIGAGRAGAVPEARAPLAQETATASRVLVAPAPPPPQAVALPPQPDAIPAPPLPVMQPTGGPVTSAEIAEVGRTSRRRRAPA